MHTKHETARWSVIVRNHCTHSPQTSFSLLSYPYLSTTTFGHQIIMFLLLSIKIGEVDFWWCHGWIDSQTSQLSIVCNKIPWNLTRIVLEIVPVVYNFRVIDMGWTKEVIPRVRCKTNKRTCMTCEDMRLEKMSSVNLRSLLETHSIENISKELKEL